MVGEIALAVLWLLSGWALKAFAKKTRADISRLERQNTQLAQTIVRDRKAVASLEEWRSLCAEKESEERNRLTVQAGKQKITAKPARVNWRQFRDAAESEPRESE